jgi:serine acetyltransferase
VTLENDLSVKGNTTLGDSATDTITLTGATTAKENVTLEKDLTTQGNTTLGDSATDTTEIKGVLTARENVTLEKDLSVQGNTTLGNSSTDITEIKGVLTADENVTVEKNLTVKDNTTLGDSATDTITLTGLTTAKEKLTAKKDLEVQGNTVLGNSATDTITLDGVTTAKENVTAEKNLVVQGSLSVDENATLEKNLTVYGNTVLGNSVSDTVETKGVLTAYENVTLEKNLTVKGNTTLGNYSSDTIQIVGKSEVKEKMQIEKDLWFGTSSKVKLTPISNDQLYLYLNGYMHRFIDTRVPSAEVNLSRFVCGIGHYEKSFQPLDTSYVITGDLFGVDVTDKFDMVKVIADVQGEMCFLSMYIRIKNFSVSVPTDEKGTINLKILDMLKTFTTITDVEGAEFASCMVLSANNVDTSTGAMHGSIIKSSGSIYMVVSESPYTSSTFNATTCVIRANTHFRVTRSL